VALRTAGVDKALHETLELLAAPDDEACEWQIWSYAPILVPNNKAVDPLSLWLSLQGATDDRVQLARDELAKRLPR